MTEWTEPSITINGTNLTTAQAMTIRVAIEHFAIDLQNDGLGDDEHGKTMTHGYLTAIDSIRGLMHDSKIKRLCDVRDRLRSFIAGDLHEHGFKGDAIDEMLEKIENGTRTF